MNPKKLWANFSVQDVERTREFYTTLGFRSNEGHQKAKELTSFRIGEDDFVVHFFSHEVLQQNIGGEIADLKLGNEIIITLAAESRQEVNAWAEEVRKAGGTIFSEPAEFGKGYYGFGFADPDGHKWNVFYM